MRKMNMKNQWKGKKQMNRRCYNYYENNQHWGVGPC